MDSGGKHKLPNERDLSRLLTVGYSPEIKRAVHTYVNQCQSDRVHKSKAVMQNYKLKMNSLISP